jgi:hypothetical protein
MATFRPTAGIRMQTHGRHCCEALQLLSPAARHMASLVRWPWPSMPLAGGFEAPPLKHSAPGAHMRPVTVRRPAGMNAREAAKSSDIVFIGACGVLGVRMAANHSSSGSIAASWSNSIRGRCGWW